MSNHPVTPPPELVKEWIRDANHNEPMFAQVASLGAQWGADQELEACCEWTAANFGELPVQNLRLYRRPKPPSLKQKALTDLSEIGSHYTGAGAAKLIDTIRRALESLPDD